MKKLNFLLIGLSIFILSSCSLTMEDKLIGSWDLELRATVFGFSDTSYGTMTFHDDGTGDINIDNEGSSVFTWAVDGENGVTIIEDGESIYLENTTNTDSRQVFYYSETSDGITVTMTFTLTK